MCGDFDQLWPDVAHAPFRTLGLPWCRSDSLSEVVLANFAYMGTCLGTEFRAAVSRRLSSVCLVGLSCGAPCRQGVQTSQAEVVRASTRKSVLRARLRAVWAELSLEHQFPSWPSAKRSLGDGRPHAPANRLCGPCTVHVGAVVRHAWPATTQERWRPHSSEAKRMRRRAYALRHQGSEAGEELCAYLDAF